MKAQFEVLLKSMLAILISTIICTVIASGPFMIYEIFDRFMNNDWVVILVYALYGILAGIICEIAARIYEKRSRDRLRKRWAYLWRVSYAGFLYIDLFICIMFTILSNF